MNYEKALQTLYVAAAMRVEGFNGTADALEGMVEDWFYYQGGRTLCEVF